MIPHSIPPSGPPMIGDNPGVFDIRKPNHMLGSSGGQSMLNEFFYTSVMNPRVDIPVLYGTPTLLWCGGDGITPTIGPAPLTKTGSPVVVDGPHVTADGTRLKEETFDGVNDCYSCATSIDALATEDFVIYIKFRTQREAVGATRHLFSTRTTGRGIQVYMFTSTPNKLYTYLNGDITNVDSAGEISYGSRNVYVAVVKRGGFTRHWLNGVEGTSIVTPTGIIGAALGFSIAARIDLASKLECGVETIAYWKGVGIADLWTAGSDARVKDITWRSTVVNSSPGGASFTRGSQASWIDTEGRWHLAASGYPRGGDAAGPRLESTNVNLCYRNKNPPDTADITTTGGMTKTLLSAVADLATAKASCWGGNVYRVTNSTGSTQYVTASAIVGAVTSFSLQVIARISAGSGARLGLYDSGTATFTDGVPIENWTVRTLAPNMTPANVNQRWAIEVPNGCQVDFIAHDIVAGERCYFPIPNHNTGAATKTGAPDVLNLGVDPSDGAGSIVMSIIPLGWSGQPASANSVDCCGAIDLCTIRGATGRLRFWDQSNIAEAPSAATKPWADGVAVDVRHSWGPQIYVNCDGEEDSDLYDGTLPAGNITMGRTAGVYAFSVPRVLIQKNYQEGACP